MPPKWFKPEEVEGLCQELVCKLDSAREIANVPFKITSGFRAPDANATAGGVEDSAHMSGKAVDLACIDGTSRFAMIKALLAAGFVRIGVYSKHLHADVDDSATKPQNVIWFGGDSH